MYRHEFKDQHVFLDDKTFSISREHGMDYGWWSVEEGVALKLPMSKRHLIQYALAYDIDLSKDSYGHMMLKQGFSIYDLAVIYIAFSNKVFTWEYNY